MLMLLVTSNIFSHILVTENVPVYLADFMFSITKNKYVFLFILNCILFVMFLDLTYFRYFIFAHIFAPISAKYGIDPLHFAMIFCVDLPLAQHSPVGSGLVVGAAIGGVTVG